MTAYPAINLVILLAIAISPIVIASLGLLISDLINEGE